jgi:hypothetical protein
MQIAALRRVEKHKGGPAERKACVNTSSWFKQYHGGGSGTSMKYGVENPLRLLLENPDAGKVRQTAFFAPVSGGGKMIVSILILVFIVAVVPAGCKTTPAGDESAPYKVARMDE